MNSLRFLGSGDSQGVPRWWCSCPICAEARTGGLNSRLRPSVLLRSGGETWLIDPGPDFRAQALAAGLSGLSGVLVTHAHNDHILGLGDVMDFARWTGAEFPVLAPPDALEILRERFGYLFRGRLANRFAALPAAGQRVGGWVVTNFPVNHGFNGLANALRFEALQHGSAWVYMPDAFQLEAASLEQLRGLRLLVTGASFWEEHAPPNTRSVHDVLEALALAERVKPEQLVLTHLGHDVDARRAGELPRWAVLAQDGMELDLQC